MAERYERPDWVRRTNAMGPAVGGADRLVPVDADALLESAVTTTGLDDFAGLGDGDWEPRFRTLVDAVNAADFHVVGRLMTREELLRCLRTRLLLTEARRREPAIADEVVAAPVVITGPARSGTSILFELLALDPGLRAPVAAEALHPVPVDGATEADRLAMAEAEQEYWADVQPEFAAIHELRSDLPVECITLTAPSFAGSHWTMVMSAATEWAPDPEADFAYHRAVLQHLQHGRPEASWVLKTPGHLLTIDPLLDAYPDARMVFTHRDPARTMPSTVSTTAMVQWLRTDHVGLDELSEMIGLFFSGALTDLTRRRREAPDWPAGDVRFHDLMADPVAAVRGAYDGIGRTMEDEHAAAIVRYLDEKPRAKFGHHRYTAEEWGFDPDALHRELADYIEHFTIEPG